MHTWATIRSPCSLKIVKYDLRNTDGNVLLQRDAIQPSEYEGHLSMYDVPYVRIFIGETTEVYLDDMFVKSKS